MFVTCTCQSVLGLLVSYLILLSESWYKLEEYIVALLPVAQDYLNISYVLAKLLIISEIFMAPRVGSIKHNSGIERSTKNILPIILLQFCTYIKVAGNKCTDMISKNLGLIKFKL